MEIGETFHSSFYETSITLNIKLNKDITKKRKVRVLGGSVG